MSERRTYIAIDLKSFYASVECQDRNLNPLTTNLVVADTSRTNKTICLAVSPSLKKLGVSGRPRLFEVEQKVKEINRERQSKLHGKQFIKEEWNRDILESHPEYKMTYIIAQPRMAKYLEYSANIYNIYLRYIAAEDIHVYSIDEVMMDVTGYLRTYHKTAEELARMMISAVYEETGITATAGIGSNLYLAKVAMDIIAKHLPADQYGVRIGELDEIKYRKLLWDHQPLTDFWRVGRGYVRKLAQHGMYTMGDIARCSIGKESEYLNEELLYKLFGINAELLIDHAWGCETCTMHAIKHYQPSNHSFSSGQVLMSGYTFSKAKLVVKEMTEQLILDLVARKMTTKQVGLYISYDAESLKDRELSMDIQTALDWYGREVPKPTNGTMNLSHHTSFSKEIMEAVERLFDKIVDARLLVRKITIAFMSIISEEDAKKRIEVTQLDLFAPPTAKAKILKVDETKDHQLQQAILSIKHKYGKNKLLKGRDLEEGATAVERNNQIGGHKA